MHYLILLCLLIPFHTFADTSVWKISKEGSDLFIGGTIHVLSPNDYPLPIEFERAYNLSQKIVFETDLIAMAQPEMQQQFIQRLMYKKGQSLIDDLKPQTHQILSKYAKSVGLMMETLNLFKPPMVMISLIMHELQRLGMGDKGVDNYFNQKALDDGKILGELESVELHLDIIENIGKGQEDDMIINTIEEMKELPLVMQKMKQAWRRGDSKKLAEIGIFPMKKDFPDLFRLILVERNNAWVPKITALLATPEVEFVLVGALHLVSDEGVLAKLRGLGYKVELFHK